MLEMFSFIQKYLPIDAFMPLFFLMAVLFYKYVFTPWDLKIKKMEGYLSDIDNKIKNNDFTAMSKQLAMINSMLNELMNIGTKINTTRDAEVKKILEKLDLIEKRITGIAERLERVKDETKDNKIDFNQQLFSIKQEISDLRSKIEPLLFIRPGVK